MGKQPVILLTRKESFSASHRLHSNNLSDEENKKIFGKCNRINGHGHNYIVEVTVKSSINPETGFVMNLSTLKDIITENVLSKVDHYHLNYDVEEFKELNPTTENLAVIIWKWLHNSLPEDMLYEVKLYETENNIVIYRGE